MLNHGFDGRLGKLSEIVIDMLEKDLGYSVEVAIVNSADYGVPQLRERALFIASSIGSASFPKTTHADPTKADLLADGRLPWVTVLDALSDLPEPSDHGDALGGLGLDLYTQNPTAYGELMRASKAFPYNHLTRTYKQSVLDIIKEMRPGQTWDAESARMQKKYAKAVAKLSKDKGITENAAHKLLVKSGNINPAFYKDYYWSAYSRLSWDSPALTITANANFLGSGRFTHPDSMRGITMREAARLQSFDDDFRFITSDSDDMDTTRVGIGMDMIGEAVPPMLSRAIANHLADQLDARTVITPTRRTA